MDNNTLNYDTYVSEIRERISAIDAVLETTQSFEDNLIKQRRRLETSLKNFYPELPPQSWEVEEKLSSLDAWRIFAALELERIYSQVRDRTDSSALEIMTDDPIYFIRESAKNLGIEAKISNEKLVIKLPLLSRKFTEISSKNPVRTKTHYYGKMYAQEVRYVVREAIELDPETVKKSISSQTKCVRYYFVSDSHNHAIDTDNYDTKAITDAALFWFRNRDEAGSCSFYYETFFSEKLERGTYILVSKFDGWTPSSDKEFLLSLFE